MDRRPREAEVLVRTEALTKRFGTTLALDSVDLEINRGSVFGFLGPNGAGKTTAIRLLLGLSLPTSGTATIGGLDPWRDTVELHRSIAYVPGEAALWPQLTGGEVIDLLGHLHGSLDPQRRDSLIERFGLDPSKKCRAYSKGNRQKVLLIAALARPSTLLILDEPTSGLDPLMEVEFRHVVNEVAAAGATVLLSSHILSEVQALCSEVGILRAGRLVEVASLDDLRRLDVAELEIGFVGAAPDLVGLAGVEHQERLSPTVVRVSFRGDLNELLSRLSGVRLTSLVSRELDLEDIFLRFYTDSRDDVAR